MYLKSENIYNNSRLPASRTEKRGSLFFAACGKHEPIPVRFSLPVAVSHRSSYQACITGCRVFLFTLCFSKIPDFAQTLPLRRLWVFTPRFFSFDLCFLYRFCGGKSEKERAVYGTKQMDQHQSESPFGAITSSPRSHHPIPAPTTRSLSSNCDSRQRLEAEAKDPVAARKVQKADREKLRRDRLNEQFNDLGNAVDPNRPKNDKATIITDTIQLLRDLTAEVSRLKSECTALSEESHELTQEKNELREEKASLKSDIDNLNAQYQQRVRVMFPWGPVDPSVVMAPPPYTFPVTLAVPPGSLQPFPFFGGQNPGAIPTNCQSPFVPYPAPANPPAELLQQQQQSYASTSHPSIKQDMRRRSSCRNFGRTDESSNVATELELKTPGSSGQQESSLADKNRKQTERKEKGATDGQCSSPLSSLQGAKESSSNSMGHI